MYKSLCIAGRVALVVCLTTISVGAQTPEADIRGLRLRLGMGEAETRRMLGERFDVTTPGNERDIALVRERGTDGEVVGYVNFDQGRVVMVTEEWPIQATSDVAIGNVLFQTLQRLTDRQASGWRLASGCSVGTTRGDGPELETQMMEIECGPRTVALSVFRSARGGGRLSVQLRTGRVVPRNR